MVSLRKGVQARMLWLPMHLRTRMGVLPRMLHVLQAHCGHTALCHAPATLPPLMLPERLLSCCAAAPRSAAAKAGKPSRLLDGNWKLPEGGKSRGRQVLAFTDQGGAQARDPLEGLERSMTAPESLKVRMPAGAQLHCMHALHSVPWPPCRCAPAEEPAACMHVHRQRCLLRADSVPTEVPAARMHVPGEVPAACSRAHAACMCP
jgi:hypothetical protein